MADADLQQFLRKVRDLNGFLARCRGEAALLEQLRDCSHHDEVVALARRHGFEIGRRWGEAAGAAAGELPAAGPHGWAHPQAAPTGERSDLWSDPCPPAGTEQVRILLQTASLRLERIHSCAAITPAGQWYEQQEHEWVLLLQGSARLRFADEGEDRLLQTGESLMITAGRRHRVTATDPSPGTIWLCLFWRED